MSENSLVIFTKASQLLAQADTIQKTKELKSMALTALEWAKRKKMGKEAEQHCFSYALEAERKMGEMLAQTERNIGAKGTGKAIVRSPAVTALPPTLAELGITKNESARAQLLVKVPEKTFDDLKTGKKNRSDVVREEKRKEIIEKLENIETQKVKKLDGVYDVIVIDPPWPMEKIERDCRPNQSQFDYPIMSEDEMTGLKIPFANDCHVFVWTTHKFLPMAFRLLERWGLKYVCCFTWHKPGGFQPMGLPQYNCEFSLYARKGTPKFIDTKAFPVCFNAERGKHSEKPEEFYDVVRRVSAGRRLDMFSRREIKGFDGWGQESK